MHSLWLPSPVRAALKPIFYFENSCKKTVFCGRMESPSNILSPERIMASKIPFFSKSKSHRKTENFTSWIFTLILLLLISFIIPASPLSAQNFLLPIHLNNRTSLDSLHLTGIGQFGLMRKARPKVPAHYHTGIDIQRPGNNYENEPIFAVCEGTVISMRQDGPYAQLIIAHEDSMKFWTVYEHIAGIRVKPGDSVSANQPLARFMNKEELNRYGWKFNHFHFEALKIEPMKLQNDASHPFRHYASYSLICYTPEELHFYFFEPLRFLKNRLEPKKIILQDDW